MQLKFVNVSFGIITSAVTFSFRTNRAYTQKHDLNLDFWIISISLKFRIVIWNALTYTYNVYSIVYTRVRQKYMNGGGAPLRVKGLWMHKYEPGCRTVEEKGWRRRHSSHGVEVEIIEGISDSVENSNKPHWRNKTTDWFIMN